MRVNENFRERHGAIAPNTIQVLDRATRNDDGSINIVATGTNLAELSSTGVTTPPEMGGKPLQQPYYRLPLQMITSNIARRGDEGIPAALPSQPQHKQMSILDELLFHPPHIDGKKGRLEKLTHPKQVGKPPKQTKPSNMMLEHRFTGGAKQIIGEMNQYYSSMYDYQHKREEIPRVSDLLHTFDEEPLTPLSSNPNKLKRLAGCIDDMPPRNEPRATARITPSSYCELDGRIDNLLSSKHTKFKPICTSTCLVTHNNMNKHSCSEMADSVTRNKTANWENVETGSAYKPLSIYSGGYNGIERAKNQLAYSNLATNALDGPSKKKIVKAQSHLKRNMIQQGTSWKELDDGPFYSSSKFFIKTAESCQKKELDNIKRFCWGPKVHSINSESNEKLSVFMKEQSVYCNENVFGTEDNALTSGQPEAGNDSNEIVTSFNYEVTEFSLSLIPENKKKTQDSTQEFDNESVLSNNSGNLCEHLSSNSD